MDFHTIAYAVEDGILTITLSRPDRLNAYTEEMGVELITALDAAEADDDVRVVIFTGEGRGFCAGADLGEGGSTFEDRDLVSAPLDDGTPRDGGGVVALRLFELRKPVIAAINGPAVGVGLTMTLPMDIRIASSRARFGFVFARRGIVPESGSSWFLPRLVGMSQAMEWVASGRVFGSEEALRGSLIRSIHEPDDLLGEARLIAREIADNTAPVSVALARRMLWSMLCADHPRLAHEIESKGLFLRGKSQDVKEGINSFLQKRPAVFTEKVSQDLPDIGV